MTILARDWFHDSWGVGTAERVSSKSKEWSRGKNEQALSTLPPKMMMIMDLCSGEAYLTNEPFIKVEIWRARGEKRASNNPFTRSAFKIKRGNAMREFSSKGRGGPQPPRVSRPKRMGRENERHRRRSRYLRSGRTRWRWRRPDNKNLPE